MNRDGIELLKEFEGWRSEAYIPVPGDVPTIGYGFTKGVKLGDKMTKPQGEARLKKEVLTYESAVQNACTASPNENQLAAMTCLAFNIGTGAFAKSTVLKAHNRGDAQSAARAFGLWNKSGGKVYAGLTRRRSAESALYLKPVPEEQEDHPMPQTIDAESTPAKSPLNVIGAVTTVGGVVGSVSSVSEQASSAVENVSTAAQAVGVVKGGIAHFAGFFGLSPLQFCCAAAIVIGIAVIFYRQRQRFAGWV